MLPTAPRTEQFHHICTKDNAPLFESCPQSYSTREVPIKTYLKKGTKICVLEDFVEYRHVAVDQTLDEPIEMPHIGEHSSNKTYQYGYIKAHHSGKDESILKESSKSHKQKVSITDLSQYDQSKETYTFKMQSIGIFHSCFPEKNGTPRQGNLVPMSRGKVTLTIPQGHQAIEELDQFEYVWLIFVFHKNSPCSVERTRIRPPRMDGNERVGIYATRTPHRPNAIGLTMAKITKVKNHELYLSGVDLVDKTPILDIKPVIPRYDCVPAINAAVPDWIGEDKYVTTIERENIIWSEEAVQQLKEIVDLKKMIYYETFDEISEAIIQVLQTDPRPVYVRKKSMEKLYGFRIDVINVRCSVSERDRIEIVEIELWEE
jgi:tRNA-Thr(GGU) m(6)t(6)A37 methyltransferase TsaA